MNKKLVFSVLSTTVVASMASTAMAQTPGPGFMIGGDVDKFYSLETFLSDEYFDQALDEMIENQEETFFVDGEGNLVGFRDALFAETEEELEAVERAATKADFGDNVYAIVGEEGKTYNPSTDPDLPGGPTGDLVVEGVSANNLKSFTISLAQAVDEDSVVASATAAATDTVKVQNASGALVNITATVSDDGKTITVANAGGTFTQLQNLTLKIDGVKSEDGSKSLTGYSQTVQVKDVTAPEVVSAVATSPKTVEIVFSEPVNGLMSTTKVWDEFYIDGIKAYGTLDVDKLASSNKVTLTLGTALTVGDHTLKVTGLSDYANFPAEEKTLTISVAADEVAPSIASAKLLTPTSAEIVFDEPVDNESVQSKLNSADFTVEGQVVTGATPKADGKTYTITWGTALDKGALVEVVISYKGIKDNYGNTVTEAKTFKFAASDDTTAPSVTGVTVNNDNTLEVTFSEDVNDFTGADLELYDKDNKKLSKTINVVAKVVSGQTSKKVYTVTIDGAATLSGTHTLKVLKDGVTDTSVRGNKNAEQTFTVTLNDKVAPKVTKAEFVNESAGEDFNKDSDVKDSKITIFFDEAMDASTLTSKANYLLDGVPVSEIPGASLTAAADNKSVTLTINKGASDDQVVFATDTDLRVLAVKDAAGNTLDTSQLNKDLGDAGLIDGFVSAPAFGDVVSKVEAVAKNQIKLTAGTGYSFVGIDPNKVKFSGADRLQVMSVSIAADAKSAVLTLNNNLTADAQFGDVAVALYAEAGAIELSNGAKTAELVVGDALTADDLIAPSIVLPTDGKLDVEGATVAVQFDETVDASSDAAQAFTVRDSKGKMLIPVTNYEASINGETVTLTFVTPEFTDTVTVALVNNNTIVDAADNLANDFAAVASDKDVVVEAAPENSAPTVANGIVDVNANVADGDITINLEEVGSEVFTDADGDTLTYTVTIDSDTNSILTNATVTDGVITLEVEGTNTGTATVTVEASDGKDSVTDTFDVTLN